MPPRISLQLDQTSLSLAPGDVTQVRVSLTNTGEVVDAFTIEVVGIASAWYNLVPNEVRLFPGQALPVVLQLRPPPAGEAPAGDYPITITATSRDDPTQVAIGQLALTLAATGEVTLGLHPSRIAGSHGLFVVTLTNPGNSPMPLVFEATDAEEKLSYTLGTPRSEPLPEPAGEQAEGSQTPATLSVPDLGAVVAKRAGRVEYEIEVPPNRMVVLPMRVEPRPIIWTGRERQFDFTVGIHPPGVEWLPSEAQVARGQLVYRPVFAAWAGLPLSMRRLLAFGIPLLLLAVAALALVNRGAGQQGTGGGEGQIPAQLTQVAMLTQTARDLANAAASQTALAATLQAQLAAANATQTALARSAADSATQTAVARANVGPGDEPMVNTLVMQLPAPDATNGEPHLQYKITGAVDARLTQKSHVVTSGQDSYGVVDYILVATTASHRTVTNTSSLVLLGPPVIVSFSGPDRPVPEGETANLSWRVRNAKTVSVDGVGSNLDSSGSGSYLVTPARTHTYILCAGNVAGQVCESFFLQVAPAPIPTYTNTPIPTATAASTPTPTPTVTVCPGDYSVSTLTGTEVVTATYDIGLHCDDCATVVDLPFTFVLYEQPFSKLGIGSNGVVAFAESRNAAISTCLPNPALDFAIAANWADLTLEGPGRGVFTSVTGTAPNRVFNIEWRAGYTGMPITTTTRFELRLFENSLVRRFDIVYGSVPTEGLGSSVGVQHDTGSRFTQYQCHAPALSDGLTLSFTITCGPPSTPAPGKPKPTPTPTATSTSGRPPELPTFAPTGTPADIPTSTPTSSPTGTWTPTPTPTWMSTATPTDTPAYSPTATYTNTPGQPTKERQKKTKTPSPTSTSTFTATPTATATSTPTDTATYTATPTETPTSTPTYTPTYTPTETPTTTPTVTPTETPTNTPTNTPTYTPTRIPTFTPTPTEDSVWTPGATPTVICIDPCPSPSATDTPIPVPGIGEGPVATRATATPTESSVPKLAPTAKGKPPKGDNGKGEKQATPDQLKLVEMVQEVAHWIVTRMPAYHMIQVYIVLPASELPPVGSTAGAAPDPTVPGQADTGSRSPVADQVLWLEPPPPMPGR